MSVVNKMLQDLENRQQQESQHSANYQPPSKKRIKYLIPLAVLVLLAAVIYLWFFQLQQTVEPKDVRIAQPIAETPNQNKSLSQNEQLPSAIKTQIENFEKTAETKQIERTEQALSSVSATGNEEDIPPSQEETLNNLESDLASSAAVEELQANAANQVINQAQDSKGTSQVEETLPRKPAVVVRKSGQKSETSTQDVHSEEESIEPDEPALSVKVASDDTQQNFAENAQKALNSGDRKNAEKWLAKLIEQSPEAFTQRKQLASLAFANGRQELAKQYLKEGLLIDASREDIRLMLSRMWQQQKDAQSAFDILDAHPVATTNVELLSSRAGLAQGLNLNDAAQKDYTILTHVQSSNAKWWLGLAISQDRLGKQQEALTAYKQANKFNQLTPEVVNFVRQRILRLTETS